MTTSTIRAYWLWGGIVGAAVLAFFAYPGSYASTSHMVLHGLCAQTPSHTFSIGDKPLPFDARMTGIYGGFLAGMIAIAARGRFFRYGNPPKSVIAVLAAFVLAMAVDGFNSLLTDLGMWHPYAPANVLRVVTGYVSGIALAVALGWLLASSVWNLSRPSPGVASLRDLWLPVLMLLPYLSLILWGPALLHLPLSVALVAAAWIMLSMLMLVIVLMAFRIDDRVRTVRHLHVPVAVAALLGVTVMLALAGVRFWLEHTFGISNTMM